MFFNKKNKRAATVYLEDDAYRSVQLQDELSAPIDDSESESDVEIEEEEEEEKCPIGKKRCQLCTLYIPISAMRCYHCHGDQKVDTVAKIKEVEARKIRKEKRHGFAVLRSDVFDDEDIKEFEEDAKPVFTDVEFKIRDKSIQKSLQRQGIYLRYYDTSVLKVNNPGFIKAHNLLPKLPILKAAWALQLEKNAHLRDFLLTLDEVRKVSTTEICELLKRQKTVFGGLWYLFEEGCQIYSWKQGCKVGASIKSSCYGSGCFSISGEMIKTNGETFYPIVEHFSIGCFDVEKLENLNVQIMNPEVMDELIERGARFAKLAVGNHYQQYQGFMMKAVTSMFCGKVEADGRVMIDTTSYNRFHPNDSKFRGTAQSNGGNQNQRQRRMQQEMWGGGGQGTQEGAKTVAEEDLFMCWPTLPGFSFKKKEWGEFLVSLCREIDFDEKAFDQLVLDADKKRLIKSLVECQRSTEIAERSYKDIITGKGDACIFLLHGPPGVGKTLTAEAVSEHLHTPLYSVSVGEIGTRPEELEQNLQRILELAGIWKASVLMDEADIFLERRSKSDIQRNAMVGIFLRSLEYHNGVLFLTTNRIKALDVAFSSRISVALHYSDLDKVSRGQVWRTFMTCLEGKEGEGSVSKDIDYGQLADVKMNGRQIRSTLKLSQSLAVYEEKPLSMSHLWATIEVAMEFEEHFNTEVREKRVMKHYYKNRLDMKGKEKEEKKTTRVLTVQLEEEEQSDSEE